MCGVQRASKPQIFITTLRLKDATSLFLAFKHRLVHKDAIAISLANTSTEAKQKWSRVCVCGRGGGGWGLKTNLQAEWAFQMFAADTVTEKPVQPFMGVLIKLENRHQKFY